MMHQTSASIKRTDWTELLFTGSYLQVFQCLKTLTQMSKLGKAFTHQQSGQILDLQFNVTLTMGSDELKTYYFLD